jgi:ADP-heptose:LPS heptosyltransferase
MDIKKIRSIDKYCGVPICFFLTLVRKILPEVQKKRKRKRVLLLILSEMGATVLALPMINELKDRYHAEKLALVTFDIHAEALKRLHVFSSLTIYPLSTKNVGSFIFSAVTLFIQKIIGRFDCVFDLEIFSRCSAVLSYMSCAPTRIGFSNGTSEGVYRGSLHTHSVVLNQYTHMSNNFLSLVTQIDSSPTSLAYIKERIECRTPLSFEVRTEGEKNLFQKTYLANCENKKVIILNPGLEDNLPIRCWPVASYNELIRKVNARGDACVVVIGRGNAAFITGEYSDLTNVLSVYDIVTLMHCAKLFISHDSGLVHIASLTPLVTIAFFGPETPLLYGPSSERAHILYAHYACSPCLNSTNHRYSRCDKNRCVSDVSVNEVYGCIEKYLV